MTLDTYYWFFSTTAQVFGALIAILGVFTVYKLQWIQQSIEWSRKDLVKHMETFERNVVSRRLDEQLRMATEEIARQEATNGGHRSLDELKIITTIIPKRRQDRTDITESFLKLMRLMLLVLANCTSRSAPAQSKLPSVGWIEMGFITFSGVRPLKWRVNR